MRLIAVAGLQGHRCQRRRARRACHGAFEAAQGREAFGGDPNARHEAPFELTFTHAERPRDRGDPRVVRRLAEQRDRPRDEVVAPERQARQEMFDCGDARGIVRRSSYALVQLGHASSLHDVLERNATAGELGGGDAQAGRPLGGEPHEHRARRSGVRVRLCGLLDSGHTRRSERFAAGKDSPAELDTEDCAR